LIIDCKRKNESEGKVNDSVLDKVLSSNGSGNENKDFIEKEEESVEKGKVEEEVNIEVVCLRRSRRVVKPP